MSEQEMVKIAMRANGIEKPDRSLILGLPTIAEKYTQTVCGFAPTTQYEEVYPTIEDYRLKASITYEFSDAVGGPPE